MVTDLTLQVRGAAGRCKVYGAPVAVRLNGGLGNGSWVEPDVRAVCGSEKISTCGCEGAPDLVVEAVFPTSRQRDYLITTLAYERAGVHEYWIVDAACEQVAVYRFEADDPHLTTHAFTMFLTSAASCKGREFAANSRTQPCHAAVLGPPKRKTSPGWVSRGGFLPR